MPDESPERPFDEAKRILQEQILRNYPNPERRGCPGDGVLKRVASSGLPPEDDPAWQHVTHCSPCYAEFLKFRSEIRTAKQHARWQRRRAMALATAAVVVLVVFAAWIFWRGTARKSPQGGAGTNTAPLIAKASRRPAYLDLQPVTFSRGARAGEAQPHLELPIGDLDLKIRLPVGSEDGQYQIQLLRQPGEAPVATGSGTAVLENHSEFLKADIDLSFLMPGSYYIAFRRDSSEWTVLPVELGR